MRCSQSLHMNRDKEEMTRSSLKQSARSFSFSDLSSTRPWIFPCSQEEVTACDSSFSMLFVFSVQGTKPAAYPNNKESHWLLWQITCYNGAGHTAGLHWHALTASVKYHDYGACVLLLPIVTLQWDLVSDVSGPAWWTTWKPTASQGCTFGCSLAVFCAASVWHQQSTSICRLGIFIVLWFFND